MSGQLSFVLSHLPRTLMVFVGSLYENGLFLTKLGVFGALDLEIPVIGMLSPLVLLLGAALSTHERSSLTPRSAAGLGLLTALYTAAGVLAAPVYHLYSGGNGAGAGGSGRDILLPAFLMLFVLVSALLSRVLEPARPGGRGAQVLCLCSCSGFALLSAVLLAQHYFIGSGLHSAELRTDQRPRKAECVLRFLKCSALCMDPGAVDVLENAQK